MRSTSVVSIEDYKRRNGDQVQRLQSAANKRQKDAEVIRRWQLRQSIETISRRMNLGTLYIQAVLRENFVAILPPIESALKRSQYEQAA